MNNAVAVAGRREANSSSSLGRRAAGGRRKTKFKFMSGEMFRLCFLPTGIDSGAEFDLFFFSPPTPFCFTFTVHIFSSGTATGLDEPVSSSLLKERRCVSAGGNPRCRFYVTGVPSFWERCAGSHCGPPPPTLLGVLESLYTAHKADVAVIS